MAAWCLSLHADYACRRSGACCTSGWPIHVETERLGEWREARASGRLAFDESGCPDGLPFQAAHDLPPGAGAVLRMRESGACVLYDGCARSCAVHRDLGHSSLPTACQHFPRRCLIEPDRTSVSLSHCCPTVARLAFRTDVAPAIVRAPASLVGHMTLEGLDAREALPPLLRPGLLADRETYRAWEAFVVRTLALDVTPDAALAAIAALTNELVRWTPGEGELSRRFEELQGSERFSAMTVLKFNGVIGEHRSAPWDCDRPIRQFLAAHAFGNWCAYNGRGLRTVVRSLEAALQAVRAEAARACASAGRALDEDLLLEAFRAADLLLVHLADPVALAERLGAVEGPER